MPRYKSKTRPHCRYCGKPIDKFTRTVYCAKPGSGMAISNSEFSATVKCETLPRNKADCQKLTNYEVVSLSYSKRGEGPDAARTVWSFTDWDGESWKDQYFCNGDHAKAFGYACAAAGMHTKAYTEATEKSDAKD